MGRSSTEASVSESPWPSGSGSGSSPPPESGSGLGAIDASRSASACAAAASAAPASSSIMPREADTTSVTRRPNSSSITTTSPRAIGLPWISRSTGSPARRLSDTTEPGRNSSVWAIVMCVRPISTASSTGTLCRRRRSAPSPPTMAAGCSGMNSISSCTVCSLLDCDVREQDVVDLHIGLGPEPLEHLLLQGVAALAAHELLAVRVRDRVGDHVTHHGLLLEQAEALRRRGALCLLGDLPLGEHETHVQLHEMVVGEVQ